MEDKLVISLLTGKKFSFEEKKTFFIGIVTQTIFDTVKFDRNMDLKNYLVPFEKMLGDGEKFKDYLYDSRTLLAARVSRLLNNSADRTIINLLIDEHVKYLIKGITKPATSKKHKKKDSNLLEDILKERLSK